MTDADRQEFLKMAQSVARIEERTIDHSRRLANIEKDAARAACAPRLAPPSGGSRAATALGTIGGAIGGGFVAALLQRLGWTQ